MATQSRTYFLIEPQITATSEVEVLGRFCANPRLPEDDFVPDDPAKLKAVLALMRNAPTEVRISNFERDTKVFNESRVQAQLVGLVGLQRDFDKADRITIQSSQAVVRSIQQVPLYFERLLGSQDILAELENLLKRHGGVAYMAVASLTLDDAQVIIERDIGNATRANSGDSLPIAPQSPVDVATGQSSHTKIRQSLKIEGTKIVGISYMKVKKHLFTSKIKLQRNYLATGKDAVYGDEEDGKPFRHSDRKASKAPTAVGIELQPLSLAEDDDIHLQNIPIIEV